MKIAKLRKILIAASAMQEKLGNNDVSKAISELESILKKVDKEEVGALVDKIERVRRSQQ